MPKFKIDSLDDLCKFGMSGESLANGGHLWYRGQANHSWTLRPAVFRDKHCCTPAFETQNACGFRARARLRALSQIDCPPWEDHFGWLTLMRHHNGYTRLLDWTESLLCAAFFCCSDVSNSEEPGAIFALDTTKMHTICMAGNPARTPGPAPEENDDVKALAKHAFTNTQSASDAHNAVVAVMPRETSLRMLVQRAVFTLHGGSASFDEHPNATAFLTKAIVTPLGKQAIGGALQVFGYDRHSLFPDLEQLSDSLMRRHRSLDGVS